MADQVSVVILHAQPGPDAGPLVRAVAAARVDLADRHAAAFAAAGATDVRVVAGPPDALPFGERLRAAATGLAADAGLVILGSGAVPLISRPERRAFLAAAGTPDGPVLANNRYSADIVAIPRVAGAVQALVDPADLATDNVLPRWLAETAGRQVRDLRSHWRLGMDIDGPSDLVLLGGRDAQALGAPDRAVIERRLTSLAALIGDPSRELLVAGRTSAASLAWLERTGACRTRALIEERGLRTSVTGQRPPGSVLGLLLERDGPGALAEHLGRLADGAIIDSRVLLAHRCGADERAWPSPEDRFASDLLLPDRIGDPWLRDLTASALEAPIPILLGGHSLVGPGLRLLPAAGRRGRPSRPDR